MKEDVEKVLFSTKEDIGKVSKEEWIEILKGLKKIIDRMLTREGVKDREEWEKIVTKLKEILDRMSMKKRH